MKKSAILFPVFVFFHSWKESILAGEQCVEIVEVTHNSELLYYE